MACLNITSLSKHIDELRVLLQNNSLDLLAINETRLNETIADNEISISGYNIVRRDRPLNGLNGGGVCFYVLSNINYIVREDLVSAIRSGDAIDWNNFKRARNNVNNAIKNAKKSYYLKSFTACDGNSRKTWEIINEVMGCKSEKAIINKLEFEDKKLTDPTEIAEGFNKFFAEIGPKLSENIEDADTCFDEFLNQSVSGNFSFQQISPSLVLSHLSK